VLRRLLIRGKQTKVDRGLADWGYTPIIQSGGHYDLRSSAQSDDQRLKAGVVLCSVGIRYKSYCANMGRSFMIDPDKVCL
jgi:nucleosome binding factor SPN SPT16 subunit